MRRMAVFTVVTLMTALAAIGPVAAAEQGPLVELKATIDQVIGILQDQSITGEGVFKEKLDKIWKVIGPRFADEEMTRRTMGVHWKGLNEQQKDKITHLYTELLKRSYLGRLEQFEGQEIFYDQERIEGDFAKIDSHFFFQGEKIPLGYNLIKENGVWKVYDLIIDGVSLIANYRRQFNKIIQKEKFEGLVIRLENKLKEEKALEDIG